MWFDGPQLVIEGVVDLSVSQNINRLGAHYPFYTDEVKKLAYILGKTVEGDEFIEWYESYINIIGDITRELSESDKLRVFDTHSNWGSYGKDEIGSNPMIQLAGGINIAAGLPGSWITVDPEWVITESPDIVILQSWDNDILVLRNESYKFYYSPYNKDCV